MRNGNKKVTFYSQCSNHDMAGYTYIFMYTPRLTKNLVSLVKSSKSKIDYIITYNSKSNIWIGNKFSVRYIIVSHKILR